MKTFKVCIERTPSRMAFELEVEAPADFEENGPPLLLVDQDGTYFVLRGQLLSGPPGDRFSYDIVEAVALNRHARGLVP